MIILPAIDICGGECVRLYKGDFTTVHKVADSYIETAKSFEQSGAEWVHMVDLDGAKMQKPVNSDVFLDVAKNTSLKVEVGGGIRTMETIDFYLNNGISRVILGSVALKNPELVKIACEKYGEKIAVGIDAKNEMVSTEGWLDTSEIDFITLAQKMVEFGVKCIIYTDISKDGTLEGVNIEHLSRLSKNVNCNIIASGGVKDVNDIQNCKNLELYGVICGKSLYSGNLNLNKAIEISQN